MEYELKYSPVNGKVVNIIRLSDNAHIPLCEANSDYQTFLKWNNETVPPRLDLNSTIPVIPPEKPRGYLAEIDALTAQVSDLKKQVDINTDKLSAIKPVE